eukprot:TRINITY_DN3520_c0_g1_i3.p3 TRINITY_DN3520_c0_g1~~TRINITY_DN3520_c0_g1_i3.p3  ORF type:complete len:157 (+),score=48.35 TRINITY_DN3520_c0_g1_i3:6-476(+)
MEEEEEEVVRRYQFLRADDEAVTREVLDRAGCGAGAKGWPAVRAGLAWLTDEAAAVRAAAAAASQTTRHPCKRSQAEEVADMLLQAKRRVFNCKAVRDFSPSQEASAAFRELVTQERWVAIDEVAGDGNCFFRASVKALFPGVQVTPEYEVRVALG